MADSNITKRALAGALRELMEEMPFDKINVTHICEKCHMSRKSFYYHFKDKYDLVNWIFDTEFISYAQAYSGASRLNERLEILEDICTYFYENRSFYRKALKIKGQNSFSEYLREYCLPFLKARVVSLLGEEAGDDFTVQFFTDAALCAIERWMTDKDCMPPGEFVSRLKRILFNGTASLHREIERSKLTEPRRDGEGT